MWWQTYQICTFVHALCFVLLLLYAHHHKERCRSYDVSRTLNVISVSASANNLSNRTTSPKQVRIDTRESGKKRGDDEILTAARVVSNKYASKIRMLWINRKVRFPIKTQEVWKRNNKHGGKHCLRFLWLAWGGRKDGGESCNITAISNS